ncbi:DUF4085 family protein [Paenibacillus sp. JJ-223]|uniref:DUF4085 family protein n=1 Tax=Paenibacillus sp. JJ-223 TaxID=2905647 RepID=UPI001F38802C|nr:DUF4085 family protein [Paenibacillus sp. JJ-223]CAH1209878.1 hypothetical protein PAECIP111890_03347 [Paenibacillus sp. JJ-223]
MKYLTKEWYELCQKTGLHFGKRVHRGAEKRDEALYKRLYKRKENEFIKMQREIYDVDPRFMLEQEGTLMIPLEKFVTGEEVSSEEMKIYEMTPEERQRIQTYIDEYDARPPFDEVNSKQQFSDNHEWSCREEIRRLPLALSSQIADERVFALGYCTKEVMRQLKLLSKENEKKMMHTLDEYRKVRQNEQIPEDIQRKFSFHDCRVIRVDSGEAVVIRLDTEGGFTNLNHITFVGAEIIKQDEIVGSCWLYEELYRIDHGYEAHVLFEDGSELIIRCNDIIIVQEPVGTD